MKVKRSEFVLKGCQTGRATTPAVLCIMLRPGASILHLGRGHRGGYRHRRVRAGFQGLGFDGVSVPCDGEAVRERMLMDGMDNIHAGEGEWERNGMNGVVWVRAGEGKR